MKRIRIGNDIEVRWSLFEAGQPYDLTGRDISLFMHCGATTIIPVTDFVVDGNKITFPYLGKDQEIMGRYAVRYVENDGKVDMRTVDVVEAFCLVPHSRNAGGEDACSHIQVCCVSLESTLEGGIPGPPGKSAYQVAVDNGFVGTEEEWLASLKGEPGEVTQESIEAALGYTPLSEDDLDAKMATVADFSDEDIAFMADVSEQEESFRLRPYYRVGFNFPQGYNEADLLQPGSPEFAEYSRKFAETHDIATPKKITITGVTLLGEIVCSAFDEEYYPRDQVYYLSALDAIGADVVIICKPHYIAIALDECTIPGWTEEFLEAEITVEY